MIQELPRIPDGPDRFDRLVQAINERLRTLKNPEQAASDAALTLADLPGGGYPVTSVEGETGTVDLTKYRQFYPARNLTISPVTVPSLPAGYYLLAIFLGARPSGTGNVVYAFSWTSAGQGRLITTGTFALNALSASGGSFATYPLFIDAGSSFVYGVTYTATGSYEFSITLTKL